MFAMEQKLLFSYCTFQKIGNRNSFVFSAGLFITMVLKVANPTLSMFLDRWEFLSKVKMRVWLYWNGIFNKTYESLILGDQSKTSDKRKGYFFPTTKGVIRNTNEDMVIKMKSDKTWHWLNKKASYRHAFT